MTTASLQDQIDALTNQLSTNDDPFDLLLRRAQLYHKSSHTANMQQDISKAAQLTKTPKDRERLEQAIKELAIGDNQYTMAVEELLETEMTLGIAQALKTKCFGKQIDQEALVKVLDQFHKACTSDGPNGLAEELAATIGVAKINQESARELSELVLRAWEDDNTESFKQLAAEYGANMYSILIHAAKDSREMVALYIGQIWVRQSRDVQANLRVLSANRPLFIQQFLATPTPFRHLLESLAADNNQMALVSQLVGAVQDPQNSSLLPDYNKDDKVPAALSRLQQLCVQLVDDWVQSTQQETRKRGFLALASLYDAGVGGQLAAGVWKLPEWIDGIWDQAEFDSRETQRALLMLAEASSSDSKIVEQMKQQGGGLVRVLSKTKELKAEATAVLAKWSAIKSKDKVEDTEDPLALADSLIGQIVDGATEGMDKTVEALGFMCLQPEIKELVAGNEHLLRRLVGNVISGSSSAAALRFSTIMVIHNLTQYRPVLTEEQKRMEQLQKLNKTGSGDKAKGEEKLSELESPQHVSARCRLVCKAGVVQLLVYVVQNKQRPTDGIKDAVAHILVSLATTPQLRGLIVQQGGAKALLAMLTADALKPDSQPRDRQIAHALAKIAISVPPHLAFTDPHTVVLLLAKLLSPAEESLLVKFEALLALTNLASDDANGIREYMAGIDNFVSMVETSMLGDHALVQRAATELLCNLVTSPLVSKRYGAESSSKDYRTHPLHLLVALADVDDKQTRSAAAGALAQLSENPKACRYLFLVHPRAPTVFKQLAGEGGDSGMKHRVSVIWANAVGGLDPELTGKIKDDKELVGVLRSMREDGPDMVYFEAAKYVLDKL